MAAACASDADTHVQGVSPPFPLQLKTADARKKRPFLAIGTFKRCITISLLGGTEGGFQGNWFSHSIIHTISRKCTLSLIIYSTSPIIWPWESRKAQSHSNYSVVFISYKNFIKPLWNFIQFWLAIG